MPGVFDHVHARAAARAPRHRASRADRPGGRGVRRATGSARAAPASRRAGRLVSSSSRPSASTLRRRFAAREQIVAQRADLVLRMVGAEGFQRDEAIERAAVVAAQAARRNRGRFPPTRRTSSRRRARSAGSRTASPAPAPAAARVAAACSATSPPSDQPHHGARGTRAAIASTQASSASGTSQSRLRPWPGRSTTCSVKRSRRRATSGANTPPCIAQPCSSTSGGPLPMTSTCSVVMRTPSCAPVATSTCVSTTVPGAGRATTQLNATMPDTTQARAPQRDAARPRFAAGTARRAAMANNSSAACIASAAPSAAGLVAHHAGGLEEQDRRDRCRRSARRRRRATTCDIDGAPACCHANAATSHHSGWLASVMPNTRWVALSDSPLRSRCSSNRRLPSGYSTAEPSTHGQRDPRRAIERVRAHGRTASATRRRGSARRPPSAGARHACAARRDRSAARTACPATTVNWKLPATSHAGPLAAAYASSR